MEKKIYIYYRESAFQSIIADFFGSVFLALLFTFNHFYLGDSKIAGFVFFIIFILYMLGKADSKMKKFTDKEKLIKYLQESI